MEEDKLTSSHQENAYNHYEIWQQSDGNCYVKMEIYRNDVIFHTFFDQDDLSKVLENIPIHLTNGYAYCSKSQKYLHHLITNFQGRGKGFQDLSVDHISRDKLDNRKRNLRLATPKEQQSNAKGIIPGTKRERKQSAQNLPDGIDELPKYITYNSEIYGPEKKHFRNYFRIEKHPGQLQDNPIIVNKWSTSKSMKISIQDKLEEAKQKLAKLNKLYIEQQRSQKSLPHVSEQ